LQSLLCLWHRQRYQQPQPNPMFELE
jgi:hypothetical protein